MIAPGRRAILKINVLNQDSRKGGGVKIGIRLNRFGLSRHRNLVLKFLQKKKNSDVTVFLKDAENGWNVDASKDH